MALRLGSCLNLCAAIDDHGTRLSLDCTGAFNLTGDGKRTTVGMVDGIGFRRGNLGTVVYGDIGLAKCFRAVAGNRGILTRHVHLTVEDELDVDRCVVRVLVDTEDGNAIALVGRDSDVFINSEECTVIVCGTVTHAND